jgi:hypothetical protein
MAHVAINIEGGLVSGDLLERIAATPEEVDGQRSTDFGVEGQKDRSNAGGSRRAAVY